MNLGEEIRDGYKVTSVMKAVWHVQLELLKKLLEVCQRYDLKIWAEAGTLLGAIRHKGYIPWDDDIDMMMMRDDFEKLIALADKEFKTPYFLQCAETEPGYFRGHAQLRKSGTTAILPGDIWQNFHQGIFIDIFVFDFLPKEESERTTLFNELEKMRSNLLAFAYDSCLSKNPMSPIKAKKEIASSGGVLSYFHKMVNLITDYDNKSKSEIGSVLWMSKNYKRYVRDLSNYRETLYMPFEDILMPIPLNYNQTMRRQYGDYMTPAKAPSQHGNVIFYPDRPYQEVLKELRAQSSLKSKLQNILSFDVRKY